MAAREPRRCCETSDASQTEALGADLAGALHPGDIVLVEGELAAGKTTLVRGAARALGVGQVVSSPTFTIGQRYPAPVPVAHLDLFRISSLHDEDPELLGDYIGAQTISFIEHPPLAVGGRQELERTVSAHGKVVARVRLAHAGGDRRKVQIEQ